ncbi:MAG: GFA family protein [Candidatus Thioglobus sp.]|uniref:GFA family protein n=1 Tax=Candidatus Thioglobus sp. TaxID=2026721 RepID=UPI002619F393|nr:GFA family protein [Candidatus Thioglobus sp.]MDC9727563.1 GFA family protein [Candidatus Thioglobus sp.]
MKTYKGSCHCKAITFSFDYGAIESGLRCNCSICRRKGALMSAFTLAPNEINIESEDGKLSLYQFDTNIAKHYFCNSCGIYPFHKTMRKPGHYRINLGCLDDVDTNAIKVEIFDGKSL